MSIEKKQSGRIEEMNKTGQIGGFGKKGFTVTGWEGCFFLFFFYPRLIQRCHSPALPRMQPACPAVQKH